MKGNTYTGTSEPKFDERLCREFYRYLGFENEANIRLIGPDVPKGQKKFVAEHFVSSEDEFVTICKENSGRYNVYVGMNERKSQGTKAEDVKTFKTFYVDIDVVREKGTNSTRRQRDACVEYAAQVAGWFINEGYERPLWVESGNGIQLYLTLPDVEVEGNHKELGLKLKSFFDLLRDKFNNEDFDIDRVNDISRLARVWGTLNVKYKEHRMCQPQYGEKIERREDDKLRRYILATEIQEPKPQIALEGTVPEEDVFTKLLLLKQKDSKLAALMDGDIGDYPSRSEAEAALACKLVFYGFSDEQIDSLMKFSKIGKWQSEGKGYHTRTLAYARDKASEAVSTQTSIVRSKPKAPTVDDIQLPVMCDTLNKAVALHGHEYVPIVLAHYYSYLGHVLRPHKIVLNDIRIDTRLHVAVPIESGWGKGNYIDVTRELIKEYLHERYESPTSYHAEQLVGKVVYDTKARKGEPKYFHNKGYLDADFLVFNEARELIDNTEYLESRKYLKESQDMIGRNQITKRGVNIPEKYTLRYCPQCTCSYYYQPMQIDADKYTDGFMGRTLHPYSPVDENTQRTSVEASLLSTPTGRGNLAKFGEWLAGFQNLDNPDGWIFGEDSRRVIVDRTHELVDYGLSRGGNPAAFTKLKTHRLKNALIIMSAIEAQARSKSFTVTPEHVNFAGDSLALIYKHELDFVDKFVKGNIGVTARQVPKYIINIVGLLDTYGAYSKESSTLSVEQVKTLTHEVLYPTKSAHSATHYYVKARGEGYIASEQEGQHDSRVWVTDKGKKFCTGLNTKTKNEK